ncbi:MAG TPA: amidohydrolase family protein [Gemmatimonadales bacterium]|jgi:imidazolonepropionase-like amidohydrolase
MLRHFVAILLCAVLAARLDAQTLTITNATVVDVSTGAMHRGTTVIIDSNRIVSVGTARPARPRGQLVDAHGMYLIPGLWDMHTHTYYSTTADLTESYTLPLFIANGITGVRDMGSALDDVLRARGAIAAHRMVGPRMVVAGPMLDGPSARSRTEIAITTAESGRNAVDSLVDRGVDFIKVQSGVPHDGYLGIAAEAKRRGIVFEGHVPDAVTASEAVASGQHTFEHLIGIFEASTPDEDEYVTRRYGAGTDPAKNKSLASLLRGYDPAREATIIALLAKNQVWQCPTLFWERGQWLVDVIDFTKDPDSAFILKSWMTRRYPSSQRSIARSMDADSLAVRERFVQHELDIVHKLYVAGVPLLAGTDTPAGVDLVPGISLHLELQRFVAAGLTPLQALRTATINPARFLGRTGDFGSVQAGRIADLVLLTGNPLTNIENTRTVAGVVADGRYWSQASLDSLRNQIKAVAAAH